QGLLGGGDPEAILAKMEGSTAWEVIRTPLSWFVKAFRAQQLWPDFIQYGSLALLVDLVLVCVVLTLDSQYLEASAAASERLYQRMQRLRSGQGILAATSGSGRARFSIPMPARLGGIGTIIWHQWLIVLRSYLLIFLVLLMGAVGLMPLIMSTREGVQNSQIIWTTAGMLVGFPNFLTPTGFLYFPRALARLEGV